VVLGVDSQQDIESLQSLRLKMYTQVLSSALEQIARGAQETLGNETSMLRRACHEVSNPLTIISNYAEVLRHQLGDDKNSGLAEAIKKEVRRVDDVLNYYLNQQEMPQFPEQRICLNQLVRETLDALRLAEIEPRKIDVELDLQESLVKVAANAVLVKQVLVNLIKNAAEAIGENGVITLKTHESISADGGRQAEIVIQDNGPGIADEIRPKLFSPVVSTKGPGHAGVGLSIVKTMVEDLGARISCHSSAVSGTVFSLQIPGSDPVAAQVEPG
jgi:signal transduction histidine kinase